MAATPAGSVGYTTSTAPPLSLSRSPQPATPYVLCGLGFRKFFLLKLCYSPRVRRQPCHWWPLPTTPSPDGPHTHPLVPTSCTLCVVILESRVPKCAGYRPTFRPVYFFGCFFGPASMMDVRSVGQRCLKVVNCTQLGASMRRVGDRCPESSGAGPSNKPPPPRGMFGSILSWVPSSA